jgi:hypothetical protein
MSRLSESAEADMFSIGGPLANQTGHVLDEGDGMGDVGTDRLFCTCIFIYFFLFFLTVDTSAEASVVQ